MLVHPLFEYVLFHFHRIYHFPVGLEINYGLDGKSKIQIQQAETDFFEESNPFPQKVTFKEWKETSIPLFFHTSSTHDWITTNAKGHAIVNYDLVASSFYLLSGWQEFYSSTRDAFGRFPYQASVQAKYGLVTLPIVNYYFEILRDAVAQAYGVDVPLKTWHGKDFATCLTHDVDHLQSAWKVAGKPALQKRKVGLFISLALRKALGRDAWFNLPQVEKELAVLNAMGTFFFLPHNKKHAGHPNADYDITSSKIQREIKRLKEAGHEIGLHGSHGSGSDSAQLQKEKSKLPVNVVGNRFHYLRFAPQNSTSVLTETGVTYDASLGFAEHFGFRNSYCHPFRLYDFKKKQMSSVWELPLNLMDITLHHPNYLQLAPHDVLPALAPMLLEIKRFNGVFTLLWHNENFTKTGLPGGLIIFKEIAQFLQAEGTKFLTGQEAVLNER